ncbi:MAG: MarR family transcriptional regulator [Myxococcales bacterium]|nr:MarR family transcriptional regulator [Myxococcales bacterium]
MTIDDALDAVQQQYPRIWHAAHRRHPPRGLSGPQPSERELTVLAHLDRHPRPVADLANHLHIAASTLSEVLGALEARGLVVRRSDPADKRRRLAELTNDARQLLRSTSPLDASRLQSALQTLTEDQRQTVATGLTLLAEALS